MEATCECGDELMNFLSSVQLHKVGRAVGWLVGWLVGCCCWIKAGILY